MEDQGNFLRQDTHPEPGLTWVFLPVVYAPVDVHSKINVPRFRSDLQEDTSLFRTGRLAKISKKIKTGKS